MPPYHRKFTDVRSLPIEVYEQREKAKNTPAGDVIISLRGVTVKHTIDKPFNRFRIRKLLVDEGYLVSQFDVLYDPDLNQGTIVTGVARNVIGTFHLVGSSWKE